MGGRYLYCGGSGVVNRAPGPPWRGTATATTDEGDPEAQSTPLRSVADKEGGVVNCIQCRRLGG